MVKDNIIFIGGGNLAEAIFSKISILNSFNIIVTQRNTVKRTYLKSKYPQINFYSTLETEPNPNDLLFLCVKPQDAKNTCNELKHLISKPIIISVMAGISVEKLSSWCNNNKIVRAMPNVLSRVGYGVTGLFFNRNMNKIQINKIVDIFNTLGKTFIFENEDYINKITTAAASSPAYVFYFLEAIIGSLVNLGFNHDIAKEISIQVFKGSLALLDNENNKNITELRQSITSKNGTTEAAINVLEQHDFNNIINDVITAGYRRAKELNQLQD